MPFLPPDHPHAQPHRVLGEIESNHNTAQPRRPGTGEERPSKHLHKRTKSAVSLRSLGKSKDEKTKESSSSSSSSKSPSKRKEKDGEQSPTKKKSTRSLTSMFQSKPSKDVEADSSHSDKENSTPPKRQVQPAAQTPIYAAFATTQEVSSTTKVPLNDREKRQSIIEQIALYDPDPQRLVESKQRNFHGYDPRLSKPIRPKSEVISSHDLGRFIENPLQRKLSDERRPMSYIDGSAGESRRPTSRDGQMAPRRGETKDDATSRGSRVKDAVARINRRTLRARDETAVDPQKFSEDFEAMLVGTDLSPCSRYMQFTDYS